MSTATMGKKKSVVKSSESEPEAQPNATLKVRPETLDLAKKLAAMRGLKSLAEFFAEPDVMEFLNHLYAGEIAKESERLKGQKRQ